MKKSILTISISFMVVMSLFANKYESAMGSAIEKLNKANDASSFIDVSLKFERIAEAEKDKWLPYYYAGLGYVWSTQSIESTVEKDKYLDKAQTLANKADELSPNNDEIVTLQGYILMLKLAVDPATRGPEYSGKAMQKFGKATALDAENPRALLLLGRMQMGTAQFFGNDLTECCATIQKGAELIRKERKKSKLDPAWGKKMAEIFEKKCQTQ